MTLGCCARDVFIVLCNLSFIEVKSLTYLIICHCHVSAEAVDKAFDTHLRSFDYLQNYLHFCVSIHRSYSLL